mmetsp:Transcript_60156/g.130464  ORF Transcript_60156/g.130464 Transcript_60156/m.130464 type:complete len:280 (-) Transcript_60156:53-892(-)
MDNPIEVIVCNAPWLEVFEVPLRLPSEVTFRDVKAALAGHFGNGASTGTADVFAKLRLVDKGDGAYHGFSDGAPVARSRRVIALGLDLPALQGRRDEEDGEDEMPPLMLHSEPPKPLVPASMESTSESPLALAARAQDIEEVRRLLLRGDDPNSRDMVGETPLFEAAAGNSAVVAAVLLLHRADPAAQSEVGAVAADMAGGTLRWLLLGQGCPAHQRDDALALLDGDLREQMEKLMRVERSSGGLARAPAAVGDPGGLAASRKSPSEGFGHFVDRRLGF